MRHSYHTEQWVPYSVEEVFRFFSNPDNLPSLMQGWQRARIESKTIVPPPGDAQSTTAAGSGSRITLSFRPFPLAPFRVQWLAEIVDFKQNQRFCDRQVSGPFTYWNHCHYILPQSQSGVPGTLIADDLEYELPAFAIVDLAHRLVLRRQLERTFAFRQQQLIHILAASHP